MTREADGWALVSAEMRHAAHPDTFPIPELEVRESLQPGDAAKLLFDIDTREGGRAIDRGIDRMWVIVKARAGRRYIGVLDSDPGLSEGLNLRPGDEVEFGPEHVVSVERPPREYIISKYGDRFFAQ